MDRSVRWSVDLVHWGGPRAGGQCFRVTRPISAAILVIIFNKRFLVISVC